MKVTFYVVSAGGPSLTLPLQKAMALLSKAGLFPETVGLWTPENLPSMRRRLLRVANGKDDGTGLGLLELVARAQKDRAAIVWSEEDEKIHKVDQ